MHNKSGVHNPSLSLPPTQDIFFFAGAIAFFAVPLSPYPNIPEGSIVLFNYVLVNFDFGPNHTREAMLFVKHKKVLNIFKKKITFPRLWLTPFEASFVAGFFLFSRFRRNKLSQLLRCQFICESLFTKLGTNSVNIGTNTILHFFAMLSVLLSLIAFKFWNH